jgi:DNA primase catalytic subunit
MPFIVDYDDFRRQDAFEFDDRDRYDRELPSLENEERRRRALEQRERDDDERRKRDEDDRRALTAAAQADLTSALEKATSEEMRILINDPTLRVSSRGRITRTRPSGRDVIRSSGQFAMQGFNLPTKKPRKKNKKHCSNLSSCLRQANSELRTKRGSLRKGKTQADIMRRAQRLLKKMK